MNTKSSLANIGEILGAQPSKFTFLNPPLIAAPYTSITDLYGSARKLPDPSKSLIPAFGDGRLTIQQAVLIPSEKGPNGESVFKALNDDLNRVRFVGNWLNQITITGPRPESQTVGDFVEVTFYGTGINLLMYALSSDLRYAVDGGSYSGSSIVTTLSTILNGRNYSPNLVIPVVSGLALGTHTVSIKLNAAGTIAVEGFEILNESSTIKVPQGEAFANGRKFANSALQSLAYNSGFDGSPVLNGRGGRAVMYLRPNGTIGKVLQQVDSVSLNLTSTDHTNESIVRSFNFREFGASRNPLGTPDDFSLELSVSRHRGFTLDDGTTTLSGQNLVPTASYNKPGVVPNGLNDFILITFVGTGLDIITQGVSGTVDASTVHIDNGSSIGTISSPNTVIQKLQKVVSGLPFGTHTVKFIRSAIAGYGLCISDFIVYGPKKPSIPSGSLELAEYNLMSDFVAGSDISISGLRATASGVLRKNPTREMVYVGSGWATDLTPSENDYALRTPTNSDYFQYTFVGTGFEALFRTGSGDASNVTVVLDGVNMTAGNFPSATIAYTGPASTGYSAPSLDLQGTSGTGRLSIKNLTFGVHTVKFTKTGAGVEPMILHALDIITPLHSPKSNLFADLQNTLTVGSNSICSSILMNPVSERKAWAQAVGITAAPTTTSTSAVPLPDLSVTIKSSGNPLIIGLDANVRNSSTANVTYLHVFVNGKLEKTYRQTTDVAAYHNTLSALTVVAAPEGINKVDVYWSVNSGTSTAENRNLTVVEL